ncbi:MAG: hypothetical protein ACFFDN_51000 [Candidatus Hodarchaeota archaeon]
MPSEKAVKSHRAAIYFDSICGSIWSIIAFTCIAYTIIHRGIYDITGFILWLCFWIVIFSTSIFFIILGIYTWYQEKHYTEKLKKRKDIKPPII